MQQNPSNPARLATFVLLTVACGLGAIFVYLGRQRDLRTRVPEVIALALLAGALYVVGVYLVERFRHGAAALWVIIAGAIFFRLSVLPLSPPLSEDVYRYQWEGRVQRAGLNPYTVYPAAAGLRWLEDPTHPLETGRTTPTLYPPLSELTFARVVTVAGYKRLFTALDLASLAEILLLLLILKQPLHRALTYAWNPGVIIAFAMCGHHDSLAVLTLLAANIFIISRRRALSIAFLALSFLAKFFPALLVPVFLKRTRWSYASVFAALVLLGYLPFLTAVPDLFRGLRDFAAGWEANDSLFRLILRAGNSKAQAELVAGALIVALVAYALKKRMEPLGASLFLTAGLILLSPAAFPWYFTWIVPFLCFYPSPPLLLISVTAVLGYSPVVAYAAGQPYKDSPFILALEYAPVLTWLAFEGWRGFPRDSGFGTRDPGQKD